MRTASTPLLAVCSLLLFGAACGNKDSAPADATKADGKAAAAGKDAPSPKADGPAAAGGSTVFKKEHTKKRCEGFTPEFVAGVFGFDVAKLEKQQPKEGKLKCNYSWNEGDEVFFARVGTMWVKKDEKSAKSHYDKATASKTQAEVEAEMKMVRKEAEKKDELKTATGKKVTKTATGAFADLTQEGVTYDVIEGIGDEAKVSSRDGSVWVRIGNAHLIFNAYRGPKKSNLTKDGRPVTDMKAIMAHEREWIQSTLAQRKEASTKLAKAWAPKLAALAQ